MVIADTQVPLHHDLQLTCPNQVAIYEEDCYEALYADVCKADAYHSVLLGINHQPDD